DEVGVGGEFRKRAGERHAVRAGVLAQRAFAGGAELDVVGADLRDAAHAQVLGEDAAHLAVAGEADAPLQGISRNAHGFAGPTLQSMYFSPAFSRASRILYMSSP